MPPDLHDYRRTTLYELERELAHELHISPDPHDEYTATDIRVVSTPFAMLRFTPPAPSTAHTMRYGPVEERALALIEHMVARIVALASCLNQNIQPHRVRLDEPIAITIEGLRTVRVAHPLLCEGFLKPWAEYTPPDTPDAALRLATNTRGCYLGGQRALLHLPLFWRPNSANLSQESAASERMVVTWALADETWTALCTRGWPRGAPERAARRDGDVSHVACTLRDGLFPPECQFDGARVEARLRELAMALPGVSFTLNDPERGPRTVHPR